MDDLLEQVEVEVLDSRRRERPATLHIPSTAQAPSKNQFRSSKARRSAAAIDAATVPSVSGKTTNGFENARGRIEIQLPATIVGVYPPSDIESLTSSGRHACDSSHPYYTGDSAVSTIKCMMSTVLFLAVVAAIIVVAFIKNPGM